MNTLEIVVGNVGNGKTTYCKEKVKDSFIIISKDGIRYSLGAGEYIFNLDYEDAIHNATLSLMTSLMVTNVDLIIDETNMDSETRMDYIYLAKVYGYKVKAVILPKLSKEESVKRRLQDNHGNTSKEEWEGVWERKNSVYEEPSLIEGFDEIILIKEK